MNYNYTIIRCQTTDKDKVMNLLSDAYEYKTIRNYVDVVYYNGDGRCERIDTKRRINDNLKKLVSNGISADTKCEYLNEWFFISK